MERRVGIGRRRLGALFALVVLASIALATRAFRSYQRSA